MPHKKLFLSLLTLFFLQITVAQRTVTAIDQKGTKIKITNNKVTDSLDAPDIDKSISNDIWLQSKVVANDTLRTVNIFDGKKWVSLEHNWKPGSIFFARLDSIPTENNSQLFWDAANNRLGVGTNSPTNELTVNGSMSSKGIFNTGTISNSGLFTNGAGINNTGTITNTGSITNTEVITNSVGTVAAPSYNFTGAATTGLFYRPTASGSLPVGLGFSVAGTEVFNSSLNQVNFLKNVRLAGKLLDGSSLAGTAGQVLSSTGATTAWIDPKLVVVKFVYEQDYKLLPEDNGTVINMYSVSNRIITVPAGFPIGYNVSMYQFGPGTVTIVGLSGVNVVNRLSRFKTAGQDAGVGLVHTYTSTSGEFFNLTGDLKK